MELKKTGPDTSLRICSMKSLLVIKPSSLGDIVHALQVVQTFARERPEYRISWVVRERFAGLVQAAPFVHEAIIFRRRDGWRAFLGLLWQLRRRRFDMVWDMQGLMRSGLMSAAVRSPEKWGRHDAREGSGFFFERAIDRPPGPEPHHALAKQLQFLPAAGITPKIYFPLELKAGPGYPWQAFFAGDPRKNFLIFTDSRGAGKEWPRFSELTRQIFQSIPDSRVAWCAGKPDQPDVPVPADRFLNLTGCSMDQMIALVRQPAIFIGNDSGPMHLAAASGNRVMGIFGPTDPREYGPYPATRPSNQFVRAPEGRLALLTVQQVFSVAEKLSAS
jgi:ADP-heptose:LPS heptosyltransferase